MRETAYNDARPHDIFINVYNWFSVPDLQEKVCGTTRFSGKTPCVTKWIPTCGGRSLIVFLKLIGYSTLVYSCWSSTGIYLKMTLVKNISMKPKNEGGLRCAFMEIDKDAVKTTFHSSNPNYQIEQPEIDEGKFQETLASIYKTDNNVVTGYDPQSGLTIEMRPNEVGYGQAVDPDPDANFQRQVEISPYSNNAEVPQNLEKINENKENSDFSLSNSDEGK